MSLHWQAWKLPDPPGGMPQGGDFTPVAGVRATLTTEEIGSGFLVHPRYAVSAAHVLTLFGEGATWVASRVALDFGHATLFADSIAIPREYFAGGASDADVAVLRITQAVCLPELVLSEQALDEGAVADGCVWGRLDGALAPSPATGRRQGGRIEYVSPNLAGHSGGPFASPACDAAELAARARWHGVHTDFRPPRTGVAVVVGADEIEDGIRAIAALTETEGS